MVGFLSGQRSKIKDPKSKGHHLPFTIYHLPFYFPLMRVGLIRVPGAEL